MNNSTLMHDNGAIKGGYSDQVFNSPAFKLYGGSFGAIFHELRNKLRDQILERELRALGLNDREVACFLTSRLGRFSMDAFSFSPTRVKEDLPDLVAEFKLQLSHLGGVEGWELDLAN